GTGAAARDVLSRGPPATVAVPGAMVVDSVLWRRLDVSGHDVCRLERSSDGWQVLGMAVFRENGVLAGVTYEVACDPAWRTRRGRVRGWHGMRSLNLDIARTAADTWTLNGAA